MKAIKLIYRYFNYYRNLFSKVGINNEDAKKNVEKVWYRECPDFFQNNKINKIYDLQIIIPVYNVEQYLEECIESVLKQKTQYSYGITIVNDGSTDESSVILQHYDGIENIEIIHQENKGFSGARNRALENINGKYVMFLDSDDVLTQDAIENLMDIAIDRDADIVAGGYRTFYDDKITATYVLGEFCQKVPVADIPGFTCMKVIRAEMLQNFCFPEDFLFEDTVLSKLVYPNCKNTYIIPNIVYNYRTRSNGISQSYNKERDCIDTFWITKYCLDEHVKRGYCLDESTYMDYLKQCYTNYLRTRYLPLDLQESLFVLTADMLIEKWNKININIRKFKMLDRAIKRKSFKAYRYVLDRWELL